MYIYLHLPSPPPPSLPLPLPFSSPPPPPSPFPSPSPSPPLSLPPPQLTSSPAAGGGYVEVMETFSSLAPILDMSVVDLEKQGQDVVRVLLWTLQ